MIVLKKQTYWLLLLFILVVGNAYAGDKKTNISNNQVVLTPGEGDFLPDTINVFHIAKDVSELFVNAISGTIYNDITGDPLLLNQIFSSNYASMDLNQAYKDAIDQQIKAKKGDFGINVRGDYTENFTPGLSVDEDLTFKRRFYVGLEWDIIKGGLFDAGNQIHQMKMKAIIQEYKSLKYADQENYRYLFNYINYIFNKKNISLLEERRTLIQKQLDFTKELYHLRYVGWEKVLLHQANLEDIDHQIFQIETFNKHIPSSIPDTLLNQLLSADDLPLFDVNLDSLMKIYNDHHSDDTITQLKLAIYKDNIKWWKDITLRPFVRYNMYVNEIDMLRNYGSAGVTLRVPLRFHNKDKLVKTQEMLYESEQLKEMEGGDNELINIYSDFGFQLKKIKALYYRKMLNDELIRKELVKKELKNADFNPVHTLGLIDDKKEIEMDILDIKKRMYINLVRLSFYLEDRNPTNFITVLSPQDFTGRYKSNIKVFVKEEDIQENEALDIANYLWKNDFVDVIIENDISVLSDYLKLMLDKTRMANIFYSLMVKIPVNGQLPNVEADVNQVLSLDNPRIIGLHYELDSLNLTTGVNEIDEIVLTDWVASIDPQIANSQIRISIGIPQGLSISLLNRIYDKFDLVFVHEKGYPNLDRVQQNYSSEMNLDKERFVLSFDGNDFADRMHLEDYIASLYDQLGLSNFAYSDFASLKNVDIKSFEMGNLAQMKSDQMNTEVREQIYEIEEKQNNNEAQEVVNQVMESSNSLNGKVYRIQIASSKVHLSSKILDTFKAENIREVSVNGYYKYTIGTYQTVEEAERQRQIYHKNSGNTGAFIVTY